MAYDDEEESNLFYRKSVLHALKLKRVINVCFFVFFFRNEELKEDNNEAEKEQSHDWRKDSSSCALF